MMRFAIEKLCCFIVFLALFCGSGCEKGPANDPRNAEVDDENFLLAVRCIRDEMYDAAIGHLNAVLKAHPIAPESSLLLGTLHLDRKNDPIGAIYFLRKYVAESDEPKRAKIAEQLIDTAKKEFLKNFPAYNGVAQNEAELVEICKALKNQNNALKAQVTLLKQKISDYETRIKTLSSTQAADGDRPTMPQHPRGEKMHIVKQGESLSTISSKYYGTPNQWPRVFEANRITMGSPENLKVGQRLLIP
jgi:LysM repeat protein